VFGSPKSHPKVKPFVDHILSFFIADHRIWFRNYQIVYEIDENTKKEKDPVLLEIGPRFVLNPIRIFEGSFGGVTLWENPNYISPNEVRKQFNRVKSMKYALRKTVKAERKEKEENDVVPKDELENVFDNEQQQEDENDNYNDADE